MTQKMHICICKYKIHKLMLATYLLVDGFWTSDSQYNGYSRVCLDEWRRAAPMLRNKERHLSSLHSELDALFWSMEYASTHDMSALWDGLKECHFNDTNPISMVGFFQQNWRR